MYYSKLVKLLGANEDLEGLRGLQYLVTNPDRLIEFAKSRGLKVHTLEAVCCRSYMELVYADTFKIH